MPFSIENGSLPIDDTAMDYVRFGRGSRILIMLPGLGDGLRTVNGTALPLAAAYRIFSKAFTVYCFSRRNHLPAGFTTREMAADIKYAMDHLGIEKADLFGVSMGGMIAQHFAADYPARLNRLVLAVTCARPNPILEESIQEWLDCVCRDDHNALMDSNLRRIYSESYYRKNRHLIPILSRLTKPESYDRFLVQAGACLTHDAFSRLKDITAETLVIGGEKDMALGTEPSREIAAQIPNAALKLYPQWGHGLYEEAPDFNKTVLDFLCL